MSETKWSREIDRIMVWSLVGAVTIAGFFGLLAYLLR